MRTDPLIQAIDMVQKAINHAKPKISACMDCGLFPVRARGLCARCYLRYWKAGKPFPLPHAKKQGKFKDDPT